MESLSNPPTMRVLGLDLHCLTYDEMHGIFDQWLSDKGRPALTVALVNVNCSVSALLDRSLFSVYRSADIRGIDSMPFLRLASVIRRRKLDRLYAPDIMLEVSKRARKTNYRFFLYGGAPGAANVIAQMLRQRFPGVTIAGTFSPPFRPLTPEEDEIVVRMIRDARPDFVWVGLGSPKQDVWIQDHKHRIRGCVMVASGATFDFFSGRIRQAPRWIRNSGFEWLFRLFQDWKRLWRRYTVYNAIFIGAFLLEILRIRQWNRPEPETR